MTHVTVLKEEAVESLNLKPDAVVVDATFGSGGHAKQILEKLDERGVYIGIDIDETAFLPHQADLEAHKAQVHLINDNFSNLDSILSSLKINQIDAVLADLGWRTEQFLESKKGFSFNDEALPLMTYGDPKKHLFTAYDIVNHWDEENIADVIFGYGEERGARRIAKAIVGRRQVKPIETSKELAEIVTEALPKFLGHKKIHPATKTFQALRIAVNDELRVIEELIKTSYEHLSSGGRIAIITFHSLEDRLVKNLFREYTHDHKAKKITKKPIIPTETEIKNNPRARSAKLRTIEKI